MINNITYQITEDTVPVSEQNMHFNIIHRLPKYPAAEKENMKAEIENSYLRFSANMSTHTKDRNTVKADMQVIPSNHGQGGIKVVL